MYTIKITLYNNRNLINMKILKAALIILAISSMPISVYSQTNSKEVVQQNENKSQSDTLIFTIYGMDCPGCEGGLEKQVNKIPAVNYSKANWVKQELIVVVRQDSTINYEELEKRVKKANFTLSTHLNKKENEK